MDSITCGKLGFARDVQPQVAVGTDGQEDRVDAVAPELVEGHLPSEGTC